MDYLDNLRTRARLVKAIRAYFDDRGFTEVTTPVRIPAPAPETHIDCPVVVARPSGAVAEARPEDLTYLRASPELQMKKLLAAGLDRIYQIGPCFREGERGARHNPEFTMIEWYRLGVDYRTIHADLCGLLEALSAAAGRPAPVFRDLTVREAYRTYAGWDPWTAWDADRFDFDMATKIEPNLPRGYVTLWDYPTAAASLARLRGDVAERWEIYCDGLELANCFTELCDGPEQRRRFEASRDERRACGESDYPLDEEFLELVPLMGSASGVALGVDRLIAALLGEGDIHAVLVAP